MIRHVEISESVLAEAHRRYGEERSAAGAASEYDFVAGPLAAAQFAFRDFDRLSYDLIPAVRSYTVVDPLFGAVTFAALLRSDSVVEIVSFADDPDYWTMLDDFPE